MFEDFFHSNVENWSILRWGLMDRKTSILKSWPGAFRLALVADTAGEQKWLNDWSRVLWRLLTFPTGGERPARVLHTISPGRQTVCAVQEKGGMGNGYRFQSLGEESWSQVNRPWRCNGLWIHVINLFSFGFHKFILGFLSQSLRSSSQ